MSSALDMSLDDLIRGRGKRNSRHGGGASRPTPHWHWRTNRLRPYPAFQKARARARARAWAPAPAPAPESSWEHDLYTPSEMGSPLVAARSSAIEPGTKLLISNLDSAVSNEDIQELFSEIGDLKRYSINYDNDRTGRSKGTAEVVFARNADALAAVQRYDTVQLDGRPMKIEIVGLHIQAPLTLIPPVIAPSLFTRGLGNRNMNAHARGFGGGSLSVGSGFGAGARGRSQGGNFSGSGGVESSKGKRSDKVLISADDLDADLERYRASGRHTR